MSANNRKRFFDQFEFEGLAFDDVRLKTGRKTATVLPSDVSLESLFSRNVPLKIPIVSAAMDTVTEAPMATAMALDGGLGIIHRHLSPEDQARHVARVKFHMNARIARPICAQETQPVADLLNMRREKKYPFHSFPVINVAGQFRGVLTTHDLDFCLSHDTLVRDVMTENAISAPEETTLEQAFDIMRTSKHKLLPLVNAAREVTGLYVWSDVQRCKTGPATNNNVDDQGQLRVGAAVGTDEEALERVRLLVAKRVDVIVIDAAHADSAPVFAIVAAIKRDFSNVDVVVGNVSMPESVERLQTLDIDGIKVGQGSGAICTSRIIAGVGSPQVTAVYRCGQKAGVPVCSDGGVHYTGDLPIAIGAGAQSVMVGRMLAGYDETPGGIVLSQGRQWKPFRGMGSLEAMLEHRGSRNRYGETGTTREQLVPEGITGLVPYQGPVASILHQCVGGIRKAMGYVGAASIEELRAIAEFERMTSAGVTESHPHNVLITGEAPNYRKEQ